MIRASISLLIGLAVTTGVVAHMDESAPRAPDNGLLFPALSAPPRDAGEAATRFVSALFRAREEMEAAGVLDVGGPAAGSGTAGTQDYPWHPYEGVWTFVRIHFNDGRSGDLRGFGRRRGFGGDPGWRHDYPAAERNFSKILNEITYTRALQSNAGGNVLEWTDPRLFQFPVAYVSEPGDWTITDDEGVAVRNYLLKGGFIIFDDFTGYAMYNLAEQMARALPELQFLPLDGTEAIFDSFFKIEPQTIVLPSYRGARPEWWGLFEDNDKEKRMLVVAGNHSDLGEYWEFSETGYFPVDLSNEAYKVGVNYSVFAMTH
jgi:hypothetical protein